MSEEALKIDLQKPNNQLPKKPTPWVNLLWILGLIIALIYSANLSEADWYRLFTNTGQMSSIIEEMFHPDWSYLSYVIDPLMETVQMAVIGTTIGAALALPFAFIAAKNIVKNPILRGLIRIILNIVRTIPDLLLGSLFVAVVGIGPVAGVAALAVFSFGMISKLFYETIETIDNGPIEAIRAVGGSTFDVIRYAVFPQIASQLLSYFLYTFEINVRASSVLGYMGAGGIGVLLQRSLSQFRYDQTSIIVIAIFIVVFVIDIINNKVREKLA